MKLFKRLSARSGESFVELLCAVLVTALAVALMSGMINTAAGLSSTAEKNDKALYKALNDAESKVQISGTGDSLTVVVTSDGGTETDVVFEDIIFCGDEGELCAYYWEGVSG